MVAQQAFNLVSEGSTPSGPTMYKIFDFECAECSSVFEDLVSDGETPVSCKHCGASGTFTRVIAAPLIPTSIVVDYPGSKRLKAGYAHHYNRQAERKGSQVSMHGSRRVK